MDKKELVDSLCKIGAIKFGSFTLKSGKESPIYVDLRLLVSHPQLLSDIANSMWELISDKQFDCICGVPYTALPIATAMSLQHDVPMIMRRKEVKDYGTKRCIEGAFEKDQTCLIIEDLVTSGMSVFETIDPIQHVGLNIQDIVVVLDREQGGRSNIEGKGYNLHSLLTMTELLESAEELGHIDRDIIHQIQEALSLNPARL
ncbi:MAG: orotate phosphoribosyltransferase [Waddliaceae bacterium]|nr:orotate phosphoribosyltransferase [Waddliaceae bacterium]